jgi:hypothetical protein
MPSANFEAMATPHLNDVIEDVTLEGVRRLTRFSSLRSAGCARSLPEGILEEGEDARVLVVRGVYYRREDETGFADERSFEVTVRPDTDNADDPFAVAVDISVVHVGFLPNTV